MKNSILLLFFACLATLHGKAQGTGGFFNQQSSKAKLMLAQIVGYETYLHEIKGGYNIAENGLNTMHEIKGGTFDLNTAYFNSLLQVSPAVSANPKGKAIAGMQQQIIQVFSKEIAWQQQQKILTVKEIIYIRQVYQNLMRKCKTDMDELTDVLTPGKLQLNDHQRLERIDHCYNATQDKQSFAMSFTGKCRQMATDRQSATKDNSQLKSLYGIN